MLVPVVLAVSRSPSPANVPPMILTVALTRSRLSGSTTVIGARLRGEPSSVYATPPLPPPRKLGGSLTLVMVTVVVLIGELTSLPPLRVPLGSCTSQVMLRVVLEP